MASKLPPPPWIASAVDTQVLERLVEDLGNSPSLLAELIAQYLLESAVWIRELSRAFAEGDVDTLLTVAHSLRSTSALLGANRLADLLQETEDATRSTLSHLLPLMFDVEREYLRVQTFLRDPSVAFDRAGALALDASS